MGDDGSARRSSFWTTLPGILTGIAALVTALVGAAALFSHSGDTPQSPASGSHVGVATASSSAPTRAPTSASAPNAAPSVDAATASTISRFVLNAGDWLDVETGITGSSVIGGDLIYRPDGLFLYGAHNAVTKGGGEAVCTTALQRRSDSYVTAQAMTRGTVVCMSTRDGALAELRFSAPDAHSRVQVAMTVWP